MLPTNNPVLIGGEFALSVQEQSSFTALVGESDNCQMAVYRLQNGSVGEHDVGFSDFEFV